MNILQIVLFLLPYCFTFADPLTERARDAELLLKNLQFEEAFGLYSSILEEIEDQTPYPLQFAYWIHRERGYAACMLDDQNTTAMDTEQMRAILQELGYPDDVMEEYYEILDLAKQAKSECTFYLPLAAGGFTSWCKTAWNKTVMTWDQGKRKLDEAYFRVTNNHVRLEQLEAEKKARELYYPNLVHSRDIMERLRKDIENKDLALGQEWRDFLLNNQTLFLTTGIGIAGVLYKANIPGPVSAAVIVGLLYKECHEAIDVIRQEAGMLWSQYQELQRNCTTLVQMENDNKTASHTKCVLEGRSPHLHFSSEKTSRSYNGYCSFNANDEKYEFEVSFGKNF